MATIEILPEEIFSEENEYLKIPDSVLDELKKYAPKNFDSLSSDNKKALELKDDSLEILISIFSGSCMISASFTDPEMSDVLVKEIKEIKKVEDIFFGIENVVFHISEKRIEKIFLEIGSVGLSDKEFNNCLINLYESYEKNRKKL